MRGEITLKKLLAVLSALSILLFASSCNNKDFSKAKKYSLPEKIASVGTGQIAENEHFVLSYDSSVDNLILYQKSTGNLCSTIPYKYYSSQEEHSEATDILLNSSVAISCINNKDQTLKDYSSYDSVVMLNNSYSVKIKNGIRVVYFFEEPQISVPVDYVLTDTGLQAKVLVKEITENELYSIYKISLLPYFVSCENNTNSYLFVPSGCGALMYSDDTKRDARLYSEPVYGEDPANDTVYKLNKSAQIHLPVFGVKNIDQGIFAVIEEGCELSYIDAIAGDTLSGYSSAYISFYLRSKSMALVKNAYGANQQVERIGKYITNQENVTVNYIVLNDDVTFNGMAAAYRDYLQSKGYLAEKENSGFLYLDIIGGAQLTKSFFGIPYKSTSTTTTLKETREIIDDILKSVDNGLVVRLRGYGEDGIDNTVLAGGFRVDKQMGNKSELKSLVNLCRQNGIALSMDFDLIHFTKSGSGFSSLTDVAQNSNNTSAKTKFYTLVTNEENSNVKPLLLLKREKIPVAAEKMLKAAQSYGLNGVSLASLSSVAYGDYTDQDYFLKANTVSDYTKIAGMLEEKNMTVVSSYANAYAAVNSDYIFDAPTASSSYFSLDKDVPFYQLVFKGNVSISSVPLNLVSNSSNEFLKAISTGTALSFTVINNYDTDLISSAYSGLSGSVYKDIKSQIIELYFKSADYLQTVSGSRIMTYSETDGVSCTLFENGITVYTNFTDSEVSTPLGTVKANDFIYSKR